MESLPDGAGGLGDASVGRALVLEPLDVDEFLRATGGALVPDEMRARQHGDGLAFEACSDARGPGLVERHAVDDGRDVDPHGGDSDLVDDAWPGEVLDRDVAYRGPETGQRPGHRPGATT
jgi:hypothetical protein